MVIKRINGTDFEKMVRNALANLQKHEAQINEMNVFPVTDGDTGTNMFLTLSHGIEYAESNRHLGEYLRSLSDGMLLGARGNSGVILSQLFKGFYLELANDSIADVGELRDAFIRGYKTAYQAVARPVEGTMLTVAREGIEKIKPQLGRNVYITNLFSMYLAEMRKTLAQTPEMLPVLKDANVVDSGGFGYIVLVEGMEKSLYGEEILLDASASATISSMPVHNKNLFNEYSTFELGYCMEFLLQKLNYKASISLEDFTRNLNTLGNSLVVVQSGSIIKVHIHTHFPARIIEYSQRFGEFISFKLDNMQLQHEELIKKVEVAPTVVHKPLATIAISNGDGVTELFDSFGVDVIIDGGKTMNTSTEEVLSAIKKISADKILVYPNHENIVKAASQAVKLSNLDNVVIMPSKSVMQCYYSLAMDIGDEENVDNRVKLMEEGCRAIQTISVTKCAKDCVCNGIVCAKDCLVVIEDGTPIASVSCYEEVVKVLKDKNKLEDVENCIIFLGMGLKDFDEGKFQEAMGHEAPSVEVTFIEGNQRVYDLIIGLV